MSETDREKWDRRYREGAYAERTGPSAFLLEQIGDVPTGRALDVACGAGRNAIHLAMQGFQVDAVDISAEALRRAEANAQALGLEINWLQRDLEQGYTLDSGYQLILVVRYVNLPLLRYLATRLAPGGLLLCEQHLQTTAEVIGPGNPAFRVKPGELAMAAEGLEILHIEEGLVEDPDGRPAALARLVARN
jgi:tellurite methyltransferase